MPPKKNAPLKETVILISEHSDGIWTVTYHPSMSGDSKMIFKAPDGRLWGSMTMEAGGETMLEVMRLELADVRKNDGNVGWLHPIDATGALLTTRATTR